MPRILTLEASPAAVLFKPSNAAVLVIDMQNDFGSPGGMFDRAGLPIDGIRAVVPNIARVLAAARRAGLKIIYIKMGFLPDLSDMGADDSPNSVRHAMVHVGHAVHNAAGKEWRLLIRDGWGTEIIDELKPREDDTVMWKSRYSGFYNTDLDALLKSSNISHLIVTGCTTSVSIDATVRDAFYRDYHCVLLTDCMAEPIGHDAPRSNHDATLAVLERLFGWTTTSGKFIAVLPTRRSVPPAADLG